MIEYGAIWTTLKMPDKEGKSVDISCGFDDIKGRLTGPLSWWEGRRELSRCGTSSVWSYLDDTEDARQGWQIRGHQLRL